MLKLISKIAIGKEWKSHFCRFKDNVLHNLYPEHVECEPTDLGRHVKSIKIVKVKKDKKSTSVFFRYVTKNEDDELLCCEILDNRSWLDVWEGSSYQRNEHEESMVHIGVTVTQVRNTHWCYQPRTVLDVPIWLIALQSCTVENKNQ
jgi:hypothetical protein